ncbi:hypothetical protein [Aquimarina sp. 2304DJ70-9]|uniref:hypothetical protein n=1 Tax=Aquimarina penaris TaxID=3231044 RepID=UPI003461CF66
MWFLVFLILLLALIMYVLFAKIEVYINTNQNQYEVQLQGLATASVEEHEQELLRIKLRVFLLNFYFYPLRKTLRKTKDNSLRQAQASKKEEVKKTEVKTSKKGSKRFSFRKIIAILRTFKVKRLLLDIDTGDDIQNAKLYPIFGFMNHYIGTFTINFEGKNQLIVQVHNRPIYIIKSFINQ